MNSHLYKPRPIQGKLTADSVIIISQSHSSGGQSLRLTLLRASMETNERLLADALSVQQGPPVELILGMARCWYMISIIIYSQVSNVFWYDVTDIQCLGINYNVIVEAKQMFVVCMLLYCYYMYNK